MARHAGVKTLLVYQIKKARKRAKFMGHEVGQGESGTLDSGFWHFAICKKCRLPMQTIVTLEAQESTGPILKHYCQGRMK